MENSLNRRELLKQGAAAGLGAAICGIAMSGCSSLKQRTTPALMMKHSTTPKDLIKVGYVGIGSQGSGHVNNLLKIEGCRITAVCDIRPQRTEWATKAITAAGHPEPTAYTQGDWDFVRMCETEDLDLVYNAAPWHWHTPICAAAMKNDKHAASEVNISMTIDECWELVEASEKYKKHCCLMENCCYDYTEMLILNMIQKGLFGELLHGECGYLHDLRDYKLNPNGYQGMWRLLESIKRDGNLYPTHGIGPMAWCMDINRGDTLDYMVSMSSKGLGLHLHAQEHYPDSQWVNQKFALGDINTCLIRTKNGKTIICKHDTNSPRPYSRDFLVQGTKGIVRKYPEELIHIEGRSPAHTWQKVETYTKEFEHPVWTNLKEKAKGAGHGGMDYIEDYRLIQALRQGVQPDFDVYDSVLWSSIIPLSEKSVANGGEPVKFPDFTRGSWAQRRPLGVDTIL